MSSLANFPDRRSNYYELLGLKPFETDVRLIDVKARERVRHARRYQVGPLADQAGRHLDLLAAATACLLDARKKREYDEQLRDQFGLPPVAVAASYHDAMANPGAARSLLRRGLIWAAAGLLAVLGLTALGWMAR